MKKKSDNGFCSGPYKYFTKNSRLYYFIKIRPQSSDLRVDWDRAAPCILDSGGLSYHHGLTYQPTILKLILRQP